MKSDELIFFGTTASSDDRRIPLLTTNNLLFTLMPLVLPSHVSSVTSSPFITALLPCDPQYDPELPVINALSVHGRAELWHQRLGHPSPAYLQATRRITTGIPDFPMPDDIHICDSCIFGAQTKSRRGPSTTQEPEFLCQEVLADFGFFAPHAQIDMHATPTATPPTIIEGQHGFKAYLILICRKTRYIWVFLTRDKTPPLDILEIWFTRFGRHNS